MNESMWELLANVFRTHLPPHTCLCNAYALAKRKTGEERMPKRDPPTVYIFPYRTRSKHWVMFILRKEGDAYTLHILQPPFLEPAAVEWATKHLQFQYKLTEAPESIAASNADGFDLTIAAPLLQWIYTDKTIVEKTRVESFLMQATETLQEARSSGENESIRPR